MLCVGANLRGIMDQLAKSQSQGDHKKGVTACLLVAPHLLYFRFVRGAPFVRGCRFVSHMQLWRCCSGAVFIVVVWWWCVQFLLLLCVIVAGV